jgi:signal transduction histidine kinase
MKNPASLVKGLVELLRSYDLTAGEQQDVMNDLMTTSSKIFQMAQEISKIVVVESGNLTLSTEPTDIRPILSQVLDRAAGKAGRKSLRVVDTTVNAVPPVLIDTGKIEEVIDTLVDNAIRVSPNGSIVEVRAWKKDSHLVVEVKDQGPGMSADDVRKAFAQTSSSSSATLTNESAMPSGLTLWFVKRIVEGHKGKVWVRSAVGRGATFAFELPLA